MIVKLNLLEIEYSAVAIEPYMSVIKKGSTEIYKNDKAWAAKKSLEAFSNL